MRKTWHFQELKLQTKYYLIQISVIVSTGGLPLSKEFFSASTSSANPDIL